MKKLSLHAYIEYVLPNYRTAYRLRDLDLEIERPDMADLERERE